MHPSFGGYTATGTLAGNFMPRAQRCKRILSGLSACPALTLALLHGLEKLYVDHLVLRDNY
jgi:hypothetical protein